MQLNGIHPVMLGAIPSSAFFGSDRSALGGGGWYFSIVTVSYQRPGGSVSGTGAGEEEPIETLCRQVGQNLTTCAAPVRAKRSPLKLAIG
jgi:hypothetical protein